jgi:hypothetical protein
MVQPRILCRIRWPRRAQGGPYHFVLRALAAQNLPQVRVVGCRDAAAKPVLHDQRGIKLIVAVKSMYVSSSVLC